MTVHFHKYDTVITIDRANFKLRLGSYRELEEALARLREAGVTIIEMELHPPDLEEVFLRITGRAS